MFSSKGAAGRLNRKRCKLDEDRMIKRMAYARERVSSGHWEFRSGSELYHKYICRDSLFCVLGNID